MFTKYEKIKKMVSEIYFSENKQGISVIACFSTWVILLRTVFAWGKSKKLYQKDDFQIRLTGL
jgi:hypothetical protein